MGSISGIDGKILRGISEDARVSVTTLARQVRCSRVTLIKHMRALEHKLGIVYTLEMDGKLMGRAEQHVVAVKFAAKPKAEFLESFFRSDPQVQEAFMTEGDFDLFVYARSKNAADYMAWESRLAKALSRYRPLIRPSELALAHTGFWPLNDSSVNDVGGSIKLDEKDRRMLYQLNRNSRSSAESLSKRTGLNGSTLRYRLDRLTKSGMIKRFTIAVQKPPHAYPMIHLADHRFSSGFEGRALEMHGAYRGIDDKESPLLNTIQILAPLSGSYKSFGISLFNSKQAAVKGVIVRSKRIHRKDGMAVDYARITRTLKGMLPFRNIDVKRNYLQM
jgi:DNA-binding Lrp family transcriptional regulator